MTQWIPPRARALALPLLLISAAASAQEQPPASERSIFDGDYVTIGAGGAIGPSYEGSDDYVVFPLGGVMGRLGPVTINPRVAGVALDLIPDADKKVSLNIGPVVRARFERNRNIKDPVVAALGTRTTAIEVGGTVGFSVNRITNPYDSLSFGVDVRWDVGKAHRGRAITPTVSYLTPLSRGTALALNISAEHVDDDYARYYYDVTPAGAVASGLPIYTAHGGWKNVGGALMGIVDLDGNLLNGGFALVGGVSYTRMLGSISESPIIAQRGSADQFIGAVGVAFTF